MEVDTTNLDVEPIEAADSAAALSDMGPGSIPGQSLDTEEAQDLAGDNLSAPAVLPKESLEDLPERPSLTRLAKALRVAPVTLKELSLPLIAERPDLEESVKAKALDPELVHSLCEIVMSSRPPSSDWLSLNQLVVLTGRAKTTLNTAIETYRSEHPEWFGVYSPRVGGGASGQISFFHPELVEIIASELKKPEPAPEGWETNWAVADRLGISEDVAKKIAAELRAEHPEWFTKYQDKIGRPLEHYHPEVINIIRHTKEELQDWTTIGGVASKLGIAHGTAKKELEKYRDERPDWFLPAGKTELISPDLLLTVEQAYSAELQPEGWETTSSFSSATGVSHKTVDRIAQEVMKEHPEWMSRFRSRVDGKLHNYLSPRLLSVISEMLPSNKPLPEGWLTMAEVAESAGLTTGFARVLLAEMFGDELDGYMGDFINKAGRVSQHFSPVLAEALVEIAASIEPAPEGWVTRRDLGLEYGVTDKVITRICDELTDPNNTDLLKIFRTPRNQPANYIAPELSSRIREELDKTTRSRFLANEQQVIKGEIKEFLNDIEEGETLESQEFEELVNLFGAERVVDILYQFRPEYRKLPVPYVKSSLTDYLGDYLVIRGEFSLEGLEKGVGLLAESAFKDGLIEVVKADCLRILNEAGRTNLESVNVHTVSEYIDHIRSETLGFTTPDLEEVLNEVEAYYQLLFENIHKPNSFVDQLGDNRLFPDINQRINVQEIAFKHRMLISDEMGMGKSASAIMAKEILGVKQALIVVPSNVVEVWQNYLVDYFKEGQAPSVLTVDSVEALEGVDAAEYDYVIVSQERLNEDYVEALGKLNYGMLIVDEMHKLKNISYGKRAECLVELAEQVSGDDEYLVLLSGTPVPNKISDVAMTLRLLYPKEFEDINNKDLVSQIINGDMLDLRSLLVPRMQMKTLAESIEMPQMTEITETFELSPEEREIYGILVEEDELTATEKLKILRQFILNPQLLDSTPDIVSSKIQAVTGALQETFANKDKVVMFVNGYVEGVMRGDQTIIDQLDVPEGVDVLTIDGSIPKDQRLAIQEELKQEGRKVLLIVSGQTADVGVDFSAAQEVYFYNEPWTEYDKRQQRGRVFRPGLKEDLVVRTFVAAGTIEDGIHKYIQTKYQAVEKLLRGIPVSEIEREMIRQSEKQKEEPDLEVNKDLAEYYFSSWDKMMRIYGHVKELGEEDFKKFLVNYDVEYAESYANLVGSRSYQANVARLSGTLLDTFVREQKKDPKAVRILDIASGPEMLKTHIAEDLARSVTSLDINRHHFDKSAGKKTVGSFTALPIADESVDYVNLSLGLHYTSFIPSKGKYERLGVFQELNRVLRTGGRGVIDMIYSLEFTTDNDFRAAMDKIGLKVVEDYTGVAEHDNTFKSQVITVEKVRPCKVDTRELAAEIGPQGLKAIKFKKTKAALRDSRKMVTAISLGQSALDINFNPTDQAALIEEQEVLDEMNGLKQQYGQIKAIPREEVVSRGLARIFNGRRYVLFKRLRAGSGAVVVR